MPNFIEIGQTSLEKSVTKIGPQTQKDFGLGESIVTECNKQSTVVGQCWQQPARHDCYLLITFGIIVVPFYQTYYKVP